MDTLTHIVVGGCIGEAVAGRQLGRRALFLGGLFQSIPDLDFISSFWLDPVSDLVNHRGFTHSFLFTILVTPLLALISIRLHRKQNISYSRWLLFIGLELLMHILLDAFNAYGTGWFEPFSYHRISFHTLFVVDPIFSILPLIAFIALLFSRASHRQKRKWVYFSLIGCAAYLMFATTSRAIVDSRVRHIAASQQIQFKRHMVSPTHFNSLLWYVVLEDDYGFNIAYRSLFDRSPTLTFEYYPKNDTLLGSYSANITINQLQKFSQGYYTLERWGDTVVFNDLRFGQITGWDKPKSRFAFHFFVNYPDENLLVVQRGRFANWNSSTVNDLFRRMWGKQNLPLPEIKSEEIK